MSLSTKAHETIYRNIAYLTILMWRNLMENKRLNANKRLEDKEQFNVGYCTLQIE
jgi:hypothetical protein